LIMLIALFAQWYAYSQREARREDRRLDRLEASMQRASATALGSGETEEPARYDQARAGQAADAQMRTAGTGGQPGDDQ
jgi:hypothetical protein